MDYTKQTAAQSNSASYYDEGLRSYMLNVYNYMASGLGLTGLIAFLVSSSQSLMHLFFGTPLQWVIMFAPLVMVFFVAPRIMSVSVNAAQMLFWAFASVMGISISWIFMAYTGESIARVFFITASVFGAMSVYGYTTKKDLTSMGSFLVMGLIGIILASIVNIFIGSSAIQFVVSILGVLIFVGLTAYDTQNIKNMYYGVAGASDVASKVAILGALQLYMDFINLFLHLLQFFGDRRS